MIDLLLTPVWVINCVLLFYYFSPLSSLPTSFGFYFLFYFILWLFFFLILSGLFDAVVASWLVKYQSFFFSFFFSIAETVMTDVALVMGFIFLFCFFVLCCRLGLLCGEEITGCENVFFLIFLVTAVILSIIDLWHGARKWFQQCIFFTDIYLLVMFVFLVCFLCVLLFCGGQTGLKVEEESKIWHFTIKYCIQPSH